MVCQSTTNGGLFHSPIDVVISNQLAYTACVLDGRRVYDIANPANPIPLGQATNRLGSARALAMAGHYVYLANSSDGLRIYDVSASTNPTCVGHADIMRLGSQHFTVTTAGNYAYVGNSDDGLHIYDVSAPANPIQVGSTNIGFVRGIAVSGNYLYIANDTGGLRIFEQVPDLSIKLTPTNAVVLSWPVPHVAFVPQQTASLAPASWVNRL